MKPPSGPKKQTQTNPISSKAKITCQKIWPHPKKLRFGIKLDFSNNDIRMTGNKNKDF